MNKIIIVFMMFSAVVSAYGKAQNEPFHQTVQYVDMNRFSKTGMSLPLFPPFLKKELKMVLRITASIKMETSVLNILTKKGNQF